MPQLPVTIIGGASHLRRRLSAVLEGTLLDGTPLELTAGSDTYRQFLDTHEGALPALVVYIADGDALKTRFAVDEIVSSIEDVRVLVLSSEISVAEFRACICAGGQGYLKLACAEKSLTHALAILRLGETVFPSQLDLASAA